MCPLSFELNDVVEFRIYRNENTVETPQWSQTYYTLQTTTITEINKLYSLKVISIEEADANIDGNVPYINKHVYRIIVPANANTNVPIVSVNNTMNILASPLIVENAQEEDITDYVSIIAGFDVLYATMVDMTDYGLEYDTQNDQFIYIGPEPLYTGPMIDGGAVRVEATDPYGFSVASPDAGVRLTPNIPYCTTSKIYNNIRLHDCWYYDNNDTTIELQFNLTNESGSSSELEVVQLDILDSSNNVLVSTTIALPDLGPGGFTTIGKTITDNISINDIYDFTISAL
jgi:hypothetical protein